MTPFFKQSFKMLRNFFKICSSWDKVHKFFLRYKETVVSRVQNLEAFTNCLKVQMSVTTLIKVIDEMLDVDESVFRFERLKQFLSVVNSVSFFRCFLNSIFNKFKVLETWKINTVW